MDRKPRKKKARNEAQKIAIEYNSYVPALDIWGLLKFLDLEVQEFDPAVLKLPDADIQDVSAFISQEVVYYNKIHHPHRVRFSICHEVGHYQLNHKSLPHKLEYDSQGADEIEAHAFSAELLMPSFLIDKEAIKSPSDISRIAAKYNVSRKAAELRIRYDGALVPSGYEYRDQSFSKVLTESDIDDFLYREHFPPPVFDISDADEVSEYYSELDLEDLKDLASMSIKLGGNEDYPEVYEVITGLIQSEREE